MSQKALLEQLVGCLAGHFRKRLYELLFGIIDILQLVQEQVVHGLDVLSEESHWPGPLYWGQNSAGVVAGTPICPVAGISANQPMTVLFRPIAET
jgi:hypothetical protein